MARTVTVELRQRPGEPVSDLSARLVEAGASLVPGLQPVPMRPVRRGAAATVVITVLVPDADVERRLRQLPGVIQVYGDPSIGPF